METIKRFIFSFVLLVSLVLVSGYLLSEVVSGIKFGDVPLLTLFFSVITLLSLYIFFRGRNKEPGSQTMHIFVAVSIKLVLELFLALIWFFILKKNGTLSILLFFVLYLAFSLFSIFYMLNSLKNKSL
ncbi:MAG: hypothetical protein WAL29_05480 [Bacteroidales bacterium]